MIVRQRNDNTPGQGAKVDNWFKVFTVLAESGRPLKVGEIARCAGISSWEVKRAVDSLSTHNIPIYQEKNGTTYYGVIRYLTKEQFFDLIGWEVPEWAVID